MQAYPEDTHQLSMLFSLIRCCSLVEIPNVKRILVPTVTHNKPTHNPRNNFLLRVIL